MIESNIYIVQNFKTKEYLCHRNASNLYYWDANFYKAKQFSDTDLVVDQFDMLDEIFRTSTIFDDVYFEIIQLHYVPKDNFDNYHSQYDANKGFMSAPDDDDDLPF